MEDKTVQLTMEKTPYVVEHAHTDDPHEAHPIDRDIMHEVCDTKMGPIMMNFDLALIQAIAVQEVLPYNCDHETWIGSYPNDTGQGAVIKNGNVQTARVHYYQVQSQTFYEILSLASQRYDRSFVEVEDVSDLAEAHTRQYLKDVHGYEGDFGGSVANESIDKEYDPTLCSAQNDAHWLREEEPENATYTFMDARGLVIEEGTHGDS